MSLFRGGPAGKFRSNRLTQVFTIVVFVLFAPKPCVVEQGLIGIIFTTQQEHLFTCHNIQDEVKENLFKAWSPGQKFPLRARQNGKKEHFEINCLQRL